MYFALAQLILVSPFLIGTLFLQLYVAVDPDDGKKISNPTDKYVGSRVRMRRLMLGMSPRKSSAKSLG